ncbi:MAG: YitT family protein [Deltaproteobacteria bacterium]|nr:YitT family protein [Deltaproteobacteria bacterium]
MPTRDFRKITMSVPWNIMLLTVGGTIYAFGLTAFAVPHELISGGIFGVSMLIFYQTGWMTVAAWYALLCIPVVIFAWLGLSRRFMLYSIYGTAVTTVAAQFITFAAPVDNPLLAAIAAGTTCGIGSGIMLRSLGSDGGLTMISMVLHQRYNIKIGGFSLVFNIILFCFALVYRDLNTVLYSIILVYVLSGIVDYSMEFTNQRKVAFIISDNAERISHEILEKLHRGVTYLYTKGAYTNQERYVILTVVHNYQLKRLEELVYRIDPKAFLIIENTFNVLGRGFSERKVY